VRLEQVVLRGGQIRAHCIDVIRYTGSPGDGACQHEDHDQTEGVGVRSCVRRPVLHLRRHIAGVVMFGHSDTAGVDVVASEIDEPEHEVLVNTGDGSMTTSLGERSRCCRSAAGVTESSTRSFRDSYGRLCNRLPDTGPAKVIRSAADLRTGSRSI
jgi:hypothetical protein